MKIKKETRYRIAYYGDDRYLAWDADNERFVPAGLHLYVTTWNDIFQVFDEMRKVKRKCSGWMPNIYIEPYTDYVVE